jgi:hypothetical protein
MGVKQMTPFKQAKFRHSRPFKRKGALCRWRIYESLNLKVKEEYHRKAGKWIDCKEGKSAYQGRSKHGQEEEE